MIESEGPVIPPQALLEAYRRGYFPMCDSDTGEHGWFSADPRGVIEIEAFHIPSRLQRALRRDGFAIRVNSAFAAVIDGCADRPETWISPVIRNSYLLLNRLGWAHSVEAWRDDRLEGGIYGVAIGGAFFGESMFHRATNASKASLVALVERLRERGYGLFDIQMVTQATAPFGAHLISAREYRSRLRTALLRACQFDGPGPRGATDQGR